MKRDSRLSGILHVLLHMAEAHGPVTSEAMAKMMQTNPVVIRRILAGLREQGFVISEKGHGGGWQLSCDLNVVTLYDIYVALESPAILAMENRSESPNCSRSDFRLSRHAGAPGANFTSYLRFRRK